MRRILWALVALLATGSPAPAQDTLLVLRPTSFSDVFSKMDLPSGALNDLAWLPGIAGIMDGVSTYDPVNNRYLVVAPPGIVFLDGATGTVLKTLVPASGNDLQAMEWDPTSGTLSGVHWVGPVLRFCSVDTTTGAYTDRDTLAGVTYIMQGESTLDPYNGRYFLKSPEGMLAVSATTGAVLETIPDTAVQLSGMEYDPGTGRLYGMRWTGTTEAFGYVDLLTKAFTPVTSVGFMSSIPTGLSTFNPVRGTYYTPTVAGMLAIQVATGALTLTSVGPASPMYPEAPYQLVPCVINQPQDQLVASGSSAHFSASTTAAAPAYQWQRYTPASGFANLTDSGLYSGTATTTLTLTGVTRADSGQLYRCLVRTGGFSTPSRNALLRVLTPVGVPETAAQPSAVAVSRDAGVLHLRPAAPPGAAYSLYDAAGRAVRTGTLQASQSAVPVGDLSAGVYVLTVQAPGGLLRFKVVL